MKSDGLETTDCTGVMIGNADLDDSCGYEPPKAAERPVLPGCEHRLGVEFEPPVFGSYYAVRGGKV